MKNLNRRFALQLMSLATAGLVAPGIGARRADAAVTALKQSIATAGARDADISKFYKSRNYEPIFVGRRDGRRRNALLKALEDAGDHGLPAARYNADELKSMMKSARSDADRGKVEVEAARRFLDYATHIRSGVLVPGRVDREIAVKVGKYDRLGTLEAFAGSSAKSYMRSLAPKKPEYVRLQKEKIRLEKLVRRGGWGDKVQAKELKPGSKSAAVVQLRNRLKKMGYMRRSSSSSYDAKLKAGVQQFQAAHGLSTDGVVGAGTMREINKPAQQRLQQVLVAMERQRWNNRPLAKHHVWVNIADYHVDIMKNGKSTFRSRVVVGKNHPDRRTPEFSDVMEHMVINPSWYIPRSITTKEYLPLLKRNPNAVGRMQIIGSNGKPVSRGSIDFTQYTEQTFPFSMKEPPSQGNALGLVKFMFPNKYNIYLHDTPAKKLFNYQERAFSHGCVRVHKPFDFAYALLSSQESDPKGVFHRLLKTRKERQVNLKKPLPVYLTYYTAWVDAKGRPRYRNDVYGRDGRIFAALAKAGVSLGGIRS